jgi:hypothetical protein
MKKISLLAALAIASFFAASAYAGQETITDSEKISSVINDCYPGLKDYYDAGVMSIESFTEETLADGSTEYDITYKFVKNYYDQDEIDNVLKEQYPDIYMMSKAGLLKDISIYRFVDKATGKILTNVAYNSTAPQREATPRHGSWFRRGRR